MATPIKGHSLASHSGTTKEIQLAGLVSCRSVQFVNCDGTPGLHCTSVSGEESWLQLQQRTSVKMILLQQLRLPGMCRTGNVMESLVWSLGGVVQDVLRHGYL